VKNILLTGASGLIGSAVLPLLLKEHAVTALVHRPEQFSFSHKQLTIIPADLGGDWDSAQLPERMDAVIHLAQSEHFREFPHKAALVFNTNTASTLRLLDYAQRAGVKHFVLASSGGIYGTGDQQFRESDEVVSRGDLGFYLGTKLCSEVLTENYASFFNVAILRFFFVYGAAQKRSMLMPRLVDAVLNGKPIILQQENGIRINPIHVSDAARAVEKALKLNESRKINVAGSEVMSLREIATAIGQQCGKTPVFEIQPNEPKHLVADTTLMQQLLHVPEVKIATGLKELF
jgi:nucleoside-diphosphate-sugar epimerase